MAANSELGDVDAHLLRQENLMEDSEGEEDWDDDEQEDGLVFFSCVCVWSKHLKPFLLQWRS